ncbi:HAD family hydrolase [Vallitalea pronyensis]|uniref:HAD family hydrolase n=1 Tax=Vallitalea pronyensis TaxID=1348613 RepID=A0A8J8SHW8_9FIRM|nr:HAD family hydrolase [Vallitalea pronyensis]QUI23847.1 HAD family hydrolase [Vallitalea pronyensis]
MKYSNIKALIFDLDDTLIEDTKGWYLSVVDVCKYIVKKYKPEGNCNVSEMVQCYEFVSNNLWDRYDEILKPLGDSHKIRSFVWRETLKRKKIYLNSKQINELINTYSELRNNHVIIQTYTRECLKKLYIAGIPMAICTNGDYNLQKNKIEKAGIQDYFKVLTCGIDIGIRKPAPEIYKRCIDELKVDINNCLYVGDSWELDVLGASSLGISVAWISDTKQSDYSKFVPRYKSINHFLKDFMSHIH